jgi:hypothetical protein
VTVLGASAYLDRMGRARAALRAAARHECADERLGALLEALEPVYRAAVDAHRVELERAAGAGGPSERRTGPGRAGRTSL